ncbi:MAG: CARDB domain-containing protein, partial [Bradymonadaceae bacterium]
RVPARPERNWENERLNNFRQNVQPDGLFDAPDLVVREIEVANQTTCAIDQRVDIKVSVANEGALSVPPGVAVDVRLTFPDRVELLPRVFTTTRLLPGHVEVLELSWELPANLIGVVFSIDATIDPDNDYNECDEDNNDLVLAGLRCIIQG